MSQHVLCSSDLAPYEIAEPGNAEDPSNFFAK